MAKVCEYPDDWRDYWEDRWDELVDEGDILNWSDHWDEVNDFLQDLWDAMNDHNYPPTSGLTNQQLIQFYYYLYPPSPAELARRFGDSFLNDYIPAIF